jgi:hypothetical protein
MHEYHNQVYQFVWFVLNEWRMVQKLVDIMGFDPITSRMLSVRSTNWAKRPSQIGTRGWIESAVVGDPSRLHEHIYRHYLITIQSSLRNRFSKLRIYCLFSQPHLTLHSNPIHSFQQINSLSTNQSSSLPKLRNKFLPQYFMVSTVSIDTWLICQRKSILEW